MDDGNSKPMPPDCGSTTPAQSQALEVQQQFREHSNIAKAAGLPP